MKVLIVDGVFDLIGSCVIRDPRDNFIREYAVEHMMNRQAIIATTRYSSVSDHRGLLSQCDELYAIKIGTQKLQDSSSIVQVKTIPMTQFELSAPGFIYLQSTFDELRKFDTKNRILLLLKAPDQNMYLDITLNPRAFGYGMEIPDVDPGETAWLAVEPGTANPVLIEPVDYVIGQYMHHILYA